MRGRGIPICKHFQFCPKFQLTINKTKFHQNWIINEDFEKNSWGAQNPFFQKVNGLILGFNISEAFPYPEITGQNWSSSWEIQGSQDLTF